MNENLIKLLVWVALYTVLFTVYIIKKKSDKKKAKKRREEALKDAANN